MQLLSNYAYLVFLAAGLFQLWYAASILHLSLRGGYAGQPPSRFAIALQLLIAFLMLFAAYVLSLDSAFQ